MRGWHDNHTWREFLGGRPLDMGFCIGQYGGWCFGSSCLLCPKCHTNHLLWFESKGTLTDRVVWKITYCTRQAGHCSHAIMRSTNKQCIKPLASTPVTASLISTLPILGSVCTLYVQMVSFHLICKKKLPLFVCKKQQEFTSVRSASSGTTCLQLCQAVLYLSPSDVCPLHATPTLPSSLFQPDKHSLSFLSTTQTPDYPNFDHHSTHIQYQTHLPCLHKQYPFDTWSGYVIKIFWSNLWLQPKGIYKMGTLHASFVRHVWSKLPQQFR